ncbi:MAG: MBL fold metallo-hydrolase [bacterium]|jgi:L-ascorbate metabolism protein UlaG (beta-lactamase superfamily)
MISIQRLNMDNSWRIDFDGTPFIVDPWLLGKEVDFFSWFNTQWHRTKPVSPREVPPFEFVLITQKYPDHFHKETLSQLRPEKVIIPNSLIRSCRKLLPGADTLIFNEGLQKVFGTDLNIHFLSTSRRIDPIYDALIVENGRRSLFLASHGFTPNAAQKALVKALPPVELLITPLNLYRLPALLGGDVSPGMESVRKLVNDINPSRVVATHDEDKHARGLVSRFARVTRAPSPEELSDPGLLGNRYLHVPDYRPVRISVSDLNISPSTSE